MHATTFGPGRLESIRLTHRTRHIGFTRDQVRARGTYRVYCGAGNDHTVTINSGWLDTADVEALDDDDIASELIEQELEDWSDPCDN